MPGRDTVFGSSVWRAGNVRVTAAGPESTTESSGIDPAAAADVSMTLRISAFVVVTSTLTLGLHAAADGGPPTPESAILIGVLLGIAGRLFALCEQSLPRLTTIIWTVQASAHFVMLTTHHHGGQGSGNNSPGGLLPLCPTTHRPATRQYICRATPRRGPPFHQLSPHASSCAATALQLRCRRQAAQVSRPFCHRSATDLPPRNLSVRLNVESALRSDR